jgi:hypothetical protein
VLRPEDGQLMAVEEEEEEDEDLLPWKARKALLRVSVYVCCLLELSVYWMSRV